MIGVRVLPGSAGYALAAAIGWREGLERKRSRAVMNGLVALTLVVVVIISVSKNP